MHFLPVWSILVLHSWYGTSYLTNGVYMNPCKTGSYIGDAALSANQLSSIRRRHRRAVTSEKEKIWPNGIIPFIVKDTFSRKDRVIIQKAIRHFEKQTCLSFIPRTSETSYIAFQQEGDCGCCSYVGRMGVNDVQGVNLADNCVQVGTVIHELGHVIGFWHEHTRPDRDNYVKILRKNIASGELKNFRKLSVDETDSLGVPYDFNSIMHYAPATFSKNGLDATILPRPANIKIGQRNKLSEYDVKQANLLYKCEGCRESSVLSKGEFEFQTGQFMNQKVSTCIWRILGSVGEKIKLKFYYNYFRFSCRRVFLQIRKGKHEKGPLFNTYCKGKIPPKEVIIDSESLWIKFHYGYRYFYSGSKPIGVKIQYQVICGGTIKKKKGTIYSPNYPDYYGKNKFCEWDIKVPKGFKITFKFEMFHLEKSKQCKYDSLEVMDGKTNRLKGKFCGSPKPPTLHTTGNTAKVTFRTDNNGSKAGFVLNFFSTSTESSDCSKNGRCQHKCIVTSKGTECICHKGYKLGKNRRSCIKDRCEFKLRLLNGWIASPNFPEEYSISGKCKWIVSTNDGQRYNLTVLTMQVRSTKRNKCTILKMKSISRGKVRKKYHPCNFTSSTFFTATNELLINTDLKEGESFRFNISLESVCGGMLFAKKRPQFFFSHFHFNTKNYPKNQKCQWLIQGKNSQIDLKFRKFDLESASASWCTYDSVRIYNGKSDSDERLGNLCGGIESTSTFTSSGEFLLIVFTTDNAVEKSGFEAEYKKRRN